MAVTFALKLPMYGQPVDAPFADCIEVARAAEDAGFSSAYAIDHIVLPGKRFVGKTNADPARPYFLDAWTSLAAVAASTTRIRIGPQVTPIGRVPPILVAKWGATLDRISGGRLTLGVGLGHQRAEYVPNGLPFPPFATRHERMVEGIEIIRRLWTEDEPVTYAGQHFSVTDVAFWPKPVQAHVPFLFGGSSPSIQSAVARLGDGWAPAAPQLGGFGPAGPTFYRDTLQRIREEAARLGRTDHIAAGALFLTTISDNPADIERAAAMLRRRAEYAGVSIEAINDQGAIIMGGPDEVCRRLEPYIAAGVEEVTVSFHPLDDIDGIRRGIDLYAGKVMPRFSG